MINNHLDPYGFMIPEIFPSGEPDSPLNLVSSCPCEFWFDGQDASTFTLNGANVITWADKSGFGRNVTQAVDGQRPTYIPATGRVSFVAANSDYLQSGAFGPLAQPNTIFIAYKITGGIGDNESVFDARTNLNQKIGYFGGSFNMGGAASIVDGATNANDNIHVGLFNGVTSEYWINGVSVANGNVGVDNLDGVTLGARGGLTNNADVEIMEVCGYNCSITAAERNAVTAYLNAKWGVY